MLDTRFVEQHVDLVKATCRRRGLDIDVDEIVRLERERRSITGQLDEARRESKHLARRWQTATDGEAIAREARAIKAREASLAQQLGEIEETLHERASWLPNLLDPRVPDGGEEHNVVVRQVGVVPSFDFTPRSHGELGELLDLIDIPRGVRAAGTRFYLLKNQLVRMRLALITMFLDRVQPLGFQVICPPFLARERTLYASGYLPFARDDTFRLRDDDLSLIGTSEQALLGIHLDEMLSELPLLYLGDSMCFRTEVGSAGRDNAGILRVHQFYKLEQIVYCHPDEAEHWHQRCLEHEEWLLRELGIPYQVVLTAAGDMGAPGKIKYDIEGWFPSQGTYRELTSNTNLGDYQTRRGNIRFKIGSERGFPHTISATGFSDRLLLAILECNQRADGSVVIPEKLVPYLGGLTAITPARGSGRL